MAIGVWVCGVPFRAAEGLKPKLCALEAEPRALTKPRSQDAQPQSPKPVAVKPKAPKPHPPESLTAQATELGGAEAVAGAQAAEVRGWTKATVYSTTVLVGRSGLGLGVKFLQQFMYVYGIYDEGLRFT